MNRNDQTYFNMFNLSQEFSLVATVITDIQIINKTSSTAVPLGDGKYVNMMFRVMVNDTSHHYSSTLIEFF